MTSFLYNIYRTFNVYLSIVVNKWCVFPFYCILNEHQCHCLQNANIVNISFTYIYSSLPFYTATPTQGHPFYMATPTQGHPFYHARFQIYWYTIWLKSYLSDSHLILFTDISRLEWSEENPITGSCAGHPMLLSNENDDWSKSIILLNIHKIVSLACVPWCGFSDLQRHDLSAEENEWEMRFYSDWLK